MTSTTTIQEPGRTLRIYGLLERADEIAAAAAEVARIIGDRRLEAMAALSAWRGRHAQTFATEADGVLGCFVALQLALEHAIASCRALPAQPSGGIGAARHGDALFMGASVPPPPPSTNVVRASPSSLRRYVTTASEQDWRLTALARRSTVAGLQADQTTDRPLSSDERAAHLGAGVPVAEVAMLTVPVTTPVPVQSVFDLPDLSEVANRAVARSDALSDWTSAVATALEEADATTLGLLLDHPELAGILAGTDPGAMSADLALAVVLASIDELDRAAGRGGADGFVGRRDLEAVLDDPTRSPALRGAAGYLLANPVLLSQLSLVRQPVAFDPGAEDVGFDAEDVRLFIELNATLRVVVGRFAELDTAHEGGQPDGHVSVDDLEAAAADADLSDDVRAAALWLLDHPMQTQRLALYEIAGTHREDPVAPRLELYGAYDAYTGETTYEASGFNRDGALALAVDQQAFAGDPAIARRFVADLPIATGGAQGISIFLCSDEGVRALANAALRDVQWDLVGQHEVIAHLPETTGAVRNQLITGFYDLLARRADELLAGDAAGDPTTPGHPGANWLLYAPWASTGVHDVITANFAVFATSPSGGQRQAAADGNQWIFDDIGRRFAALLELYERSPRPADAELRRFFTEEFGDGDAEIRAGFAAYVDVLDTTYPPLRQRRMFEANLLVATHEQAGAQPYLEAMGEGIVWDSLVTRYIQLEVAGRTIDVQEDLEPNGASGNLIVPRPIVSFDTAGATAGGYGVPGLPDIGGVEVGEPGFPTSLEHWYQEGGRYGDVCELAPGPAFPIECRFVDDPDALAGTGASSWMDPDERMWTIARLFEQLHVDPVLYDTERIGAPLSEVDWLDDEARPRR